uniref:Putative NADH ubiquinone oxidoreductase domain,20 kDa subunit n=1 Tax=mine drainage metagenome TaxID=410659 RepID=E6PV80_9ZZZZ
MWKTLRQIVRVGRISEPGSSDSAAVQAAISPQIRAELLRILGRALAVRVVDAGSCNGCELEINALSNPYTNLEGLGMHFVASPRHADLLLVTGPVSRHMELALRRTFDAMPAPRLVVAAGDCAANCGVFGAGYASCGRVADVLPVDVTVAGCPPAPADLLAGILQAVQRRV